MKMKNRAFVFGVVGVVAAWGSCREPMTFCNPLDLDYGFRNELGFHEGADPVCLTYKGDYYLFASKSGGYWWSPDFVCWRKVSPPNLPLANYAPTAMEYRGELYFTASGAGIFKSSRPKDEDSWELVNAQKSNVDPALFADDDGRVFLYAGCAAGKRRGAPTVIELDPANQFKRIGAAAECVRPLESERGWEVRGNTNQGHGLDRSDKEPWIEGSWMNKHGGKYYYQYAAPGTEFDTYGDGVCVSRSPMGPFVYEPYSPFSFKPTGFIPGAGHGATFQDKHQRLWHVATGVIRGVERRVVLFPARIDAAGRLFAETAFGDLPQYLPGKNPSPGKGNLVGWMELGCGKAVSASSEHSGARLARCAFDTSIRSWWQPKGSDSNAWIGVDLGAIKRVCAIQVHFAETEEVRRSTNSLPQDFVQKYRVDCSDDGVHWVTRVDQSQNPKDRMNAYHELENPVATRHLRLINCGTKSGYFAVAGLRVFGTGEGTPPAPASNVRVVRGKADRRHVTVEWEGGAGAKGAVVRYGVAADAMFTPFEIRGQTRLDIYSLNAGAPYWFTVDTFNENGITRMRADPVFVE
ncbi:MAG TPA: family 43 glycosylhydrolase [Kiritimatiellia bacterium]|nr:family 43 glycosylhydrolase [Kiritimatiellia bacterium]